MLIFLLLFIPAGTCVLVRAMRVRSQIEWVHLFAITLTFVLAATVAIRGPVDALSRFMVLIIAFVAAIAGVYSIGYIRGRQLFPSASVLCVVPSIRVDDAAGGNYR
jgi:formate hydrogenlyase subunit 3/multisubunit Na+/H+ antiporter MnhD subunit